MSLYLGPEFWDAVEVFGIHAGLLYEPPLGLRLTKVLFGFVIVSFLPSKAFLAPYVPYAFDVDGWIAGELHPLRAERGERLLRPNGSPTLT